jgi:hypothetical protein
MLGEVLGELEEAWERRNKPGLFTGREVNGGEEPPELFAGIM